MISFATIQQFARKLQTTELNIQREYIQHVFLSYFYQQPNTDTIYFKGGTALRIIHHSPRFSEDLDFNASKSDINSLETIIIQTLSSIEREGIKTELKEAKKTSGGYLAIINFLLGGRQLSLQLELSQRRAINKGEVVTVANNFIPPYNLTALSQKELIGEKIAAVLTRKKARDFYDLYFILRADLIPTEEKKVLPKVLNLSKKTTIRFENELKNFLPKSHWSVIKNFKQTLDSEIQRSF